MEAKTKYILATVAGTLSYEQIVVEPVCTMMTPAKFPGLI